jgi:hypothetical protein
MARTSESAVQDVLNTSITNLTPWIEAATEVVDDIAAQDSTIDSTRLEKIERFYAAYLATAKDPRFESQSGASRSGSYYDVEGDGNASYKEVAISMDPTGTVDSAGKPSATVDVPDVKDL